MKGTSPPCKRRKLDIADVSCMVASRKKAAFLSPEKANAVNIDDFSQELIEEEDGIIQSSVPQYLDHVFGGCIGGSQPSGHNSTVVSSLCSSATATTPAASVSGSDSYPVIQESQGFTVTNTVSDEMSPANTVADAAVKRGSPELSPLLFQSPTSPSKSPLTNSSSSQTHSPSCESHCSKRTDKCTSSVPKTADLFSKRSNTERETSAKAMAKEPKYTYPPSCVSLAECSHMKPESIISVLAIILQVNAVMDMACKKGPLTGSTVPMSSVLLADPTKSCVKLLLWREAACWVERMVAGDIVYFTCIRLKQWQGEVVAHTIMYSKVLNLHQPKKNLPSKLLRTVPMESVRCLLEWGKSRHRYLFRGYQTIPTSQRPVHFRTYDELGVESTIHFRAKLAAIISERVVLLSDKPGREIFLYLLGGVWYRELSEGVGQIWELQYLAVVLEGTQGNYALQVTSRSQLRRIPVDSSITRSMLEQFPSSSQTACVLTVTSISDLLEHKSTGVYKCQAKATAFNFQLQGDSVLSLHSLSELSGLKLVSQLLQAVYVGCAACTKPLAQDENCVYSPCDDCVMKTPGCRLSSAHCYRPLVISLCDNSATLEVVANQVAVSKLLGGVEAAEVIRMKLAQNQSQITAVKEAVGRLMRASDSGCCWILNIVFAVDEFSFVESLTVSLLDSIMP